ncbi:ubiquitin-related domain-containing protein [Mycena leptocephala]|nr:ubiquitin-related domain-containing protein [Mycena leptocephala]
MDTDNVPPTDEVEQLPLEDPPTPAVPQTPQTALTFLLVSGRRRTMAFDPATTVGRVKELVWNAWPSEPEWQAERPPAPSYLRILYLGKMLQDEDTLASQSSPTPAPPPTIVHLSIRAYAPPSDDAPKKKKSTRRRAATDPASADSVPGAPGADEDADNGGGCCCVIC